jgi:hypothetical protein
MKPLIAILILLVATVATAQPLVLSQSPGDGVHVLTIKQGQATLQRATVLQVGPVVPIDPIDPVDPTPDDDRALLISNLIQALPASNARHQSAIKFAGTLKMLAEQVRNGTLPTAAISHVYGPLMAVAVSDPAWAHIKQAVLDGLVNCPSPAACASVLEAYVTGAMSTVPSKADPNVMRGTSDDEIMAAAEDYEVGLDWAALLKILLPLLLALLQQWMSLSAIQAALILIA